MPGFFIARMVCTPTARYTCPLNAGFLLPKNSELQNIKILSSSGRRQATGIGRGRRQVNTV